MYSPLKAKFGDNLKWFIWDDMSHGFVIRGDLNVTAVKSRVDEAMKETMNFLTAKMPLTSPIKSASEFNKVALLVLAFIFFVLF